MRHIQSFTELGLNSELLYIKRSEITPGALKDERH